jgi:predicted outer membrane lipoprotein
MTPVERATVAVFGVLLASIFGVLLAWVFQVMEITVGTHDEGKTGTSTEKIEILRVRPLPPSAPDRFMLIGRRGTDEREGYWTNPETGEQVKVLESRPVPITIPWVGFMLIGRDDQG